MNALLVKNVQITHVIQAFCYYKYYIQGIDNKCIGTEVLVDTTYII